MSPCALTYLVNMLTHICRWSVRGSSAQTEVASISAEQTAMKCDDHFSNLPLYTVVVSFFSESCMRPVHAPPNAALKHQVMER